LDAILREKQIDDHVCAGIIWELLQTISYLHRKGIAHRDIKIENIIIGTDGLINLIDFGFATNFENISSDKYFVGSPCYIAPEMLAGEHYDVGVDMFSLGTVTFVMLFGCMPFKGKTVEQKLESNYKWEIGFPRNAKSVSSVAVDFI
jgi:serine/threonine protein kinase